MNSVKEEKVDNRGAPNVKICLGRRQKLLITSSSINSAYAEKQSQTVAHLFTINQSVVFLQNKEYLFLNFFQASCVSACLSVAQFFFNFIIGSVTTQWSHLSVGRRVGRPFLISEKGGKLHFHAPI